MQAQLLLDSGAINRDDLFKMHFSQSSVGKFSKQFQEKPLDLSFDSLKYSKNTSFEGFNFLEYFLGTSRVGTSKK